jgi:CelD/BcsL family acetyltransferase involved in cellulose biosynthesis
VNVAPLGGAAAAEELALSDSGWMEFVASCRDAVPYHHPAWASVVAEPYGFRSFVLALRDASGRVTAGVPVVEVKAPFRPLRWVSLPYTDSLHPLAYDDASRDRLLAELDSLRQEAGVASAELRAAIRGPNVHPLSDAYVHLLDLGPDPDAVYRTFKRSQIQKRIESGQRAGTLVRRGEARSDLTRVFYELHTLTRRRHGVPVQPRRLFEVIWERIVEPGLGFVLVAEVEGRPAAGAVFLAWNGTIVYKYSAARPELFRFRPVHLILWHAIRWACESGYRSFDFGRSELDDDSLREFKRGWGTEERPLHYSALADRPPSASTRPPRALEAVIRRSPLFVTRLLGEFFYRYAA